MDPVQIVRPPSRPTVTILKPLKRSGDRPSGGMLKELWEHHYPRDFVLTIFSYIRNHRAFFDDVFAGNWDRKLKPIPFFFACCSLVILASSISPFESPLEPTAPAWTDVFVKLGEAEQADFLAAFGLANDPEATLAGMELHLREVLGRPEGSITGEHLFPYLKENGYTTVGLRIENLVLTTKADGQLSDLGFTLAMNLLLIYLWIFWRVSHRFLKAPHRTPKETVYVYLYNFSLFLLGVYVPMMFIGEGESPLSLVVLVVFIYIAVKGVRVFRYTHGAGFWRLYWAAFKTNLVLLTLFIPLLFMKQEKRIDQPGAIGR